MLVNIQNLLDFAGKLVEILGNKKNLFDLA
jgi:hypothetical protein